MVTADERDAVGVSNFEREEQQEGLDAVESAVDEVAQKQVRRVRHLAAHFEQLHQIVVLTVNVAADLRHQS